MFIIRTTPAFVGGESENSQLVIAPSLHELDLKNVFFYLASGQLGRHGFNSDPIMCGWNKW